MAIITYTRENTLLKLKCQVKNIVRNLKSNKAKVKGESNLYELDIIIIFGKLLIIYNAVTNNKEEFQL